MKLNWNFLGGGGGYKTKNLPWGEYGYFLELHILYFTVLKLLHGKFEIQKEDMH